MSLPVCVNAFVCVLARLFVSLSYPVFSPLPAYDSLSLSFLSCLSSLFLVVESHLHTGFVANIFIFKILSLIAYQQSLLHQWPDITCTHLHQHDLVSLKSNLVNNVLCLNI